MENEKKSNIDIAALFSPASRNGVWIKYRLDKDFNWSHPQCILSQEVMQDYQYRIFLGAFDGKRYFKPYKITIAWWTGVGENDFGEKSVIEFYPRSCITLKDYLCKKFRIITRCDYNVLHDEYKVYLLCKVDESGKAEYSFEIVKAVNAAVYDSGVISPGYISTRLNSGKGERILKTI